MGLDGSDDCREYAIVGRTNSTSFVDISNPVNPVVVANMAKTPQAQGSS